MSQSCSHRLFLQNTKALRDSVVAKSAITAADGRPESLPEQKELMVRLVENFVLLKQL